MMQMIAAAMEAQRWEPLRTSQDTQSPPRNMPMLLNIARFRNAEIPKWASYQCLSKIDDADTFCQHEVTDGAFHQEKQCVTSTVCALKIRVSLVRFRSWAPFFLRNFCSDSMTCVGNPSAGQIRVSCDFALHSDAVPDEFHDGCQHECQQIRPHDRGVKQAPCGVLFSESCPQLSNAWPWPSWAVSLGDCDDHAEAG
jgi:hypothetical protein